MQSGEPVESADRSARALIQRHGVSEEHPAVKRSRLPIIAGFVALVVAAHLIAAYFLFSPPRQSLLPADIVGSLGNAGFTLAQGIEKEPCNRALINDMAGKLSRANHFSSVLTLYNSRVALCGECKDLLPTVYDAHMGLMQYQEALDAADILVADHPGDPSARGWRSRAREKTGDILGAYEDMLMALSLFSDPARVHAQVFYDTAKLAAKAGFLCEAANILRDFVAFDARKRRTQQMDTLMKDWEKKGACAKVSGNGNAKVRYSTRNAAILVPVEVNGVQARMIVDTGATMTLLTQGFAKRAGVETVRKLGSVVTTANGRTWVNGGLAETMTLGGASLKRVPLHVHSAQGASLGEDVDGLLGLSFLGNFKMSLNNGVLELSPLE